MDDLFATAVESLLDLYGSSGTLEFENGTQTAVRVSPHFPAALAGTPENAGAQYLLFESSVLIQAPSNMTGEILPFRTVLIQNSVRYTVCTVSAIPGNAFELGLKQ